MRPFREHANVMMMRRASIDDSHECLRKWVVVPLCNGVIGSSSEYHQKLVFNSCDALRLRQ